MTRGGPSDDPRLRESPRRFCPAVILRLRGWGNPGGVSLRGGGVEEVEGEVDDGVEGEGGALLPGGVELSTRS